MRTIQTLLLGAALTAVSALPAVASPGHHSYHSGPSYRPSAPMYRPAPPSPRERKEYRAQLRLRQLGFYHGRVDGQIGPMTQRAIARYQRSRHLRITGWLDVRTLRSLGVI